MCVQKKQEEIEPNLCCLKADLEILLHPLMKFNVDFKHDIGPPILGRGEGG